MPPACLLSSQAAHPKAQRRRGRARIMAFQHHCLYRLPSLPFSSGAEWAQLNAACRWRQSYTALFCRAKKAQAGRPTRAEARVDHLPLRRQVGRNVLLHCRLCRQQDETRSFRPRTRTVRRSGRAPFCVAKRGQLKTDGNNSLVFSCVSGLQVSGPCRISGAAARFLWTPARLRAWARICRGRARTAHGAFRPLS